MAKRLAVAIADNIISPLGLTSSENYDAIKEGRTALKRYERIWDIPEPFMAALLDRERVLSLYEEEKIKGDFSLCEKLAILSIKKAIKQCDVNIASEKTLLIFSTTKGNVDLLRKTEPIPDNRVFLSEAANAIASFFGNPNQPLVVSNACTSGVCAQIEAARLLSSGYYNYIIVCGVDVLSPFIISGFQSLKALADNPCRPFDENRIGINMGDAAATIIYKGIEESELTDCNWYIVNSAIRNDAFHISSPSNKGEGSYRALFHILQGINKDDIAFINAHGTATLFNDEMEAVAIDRAGLNMIPVNSLKGYFGHTMGAAGILETIISMYSLNEGIILPTKGFENLGVSKPIIINSQITHTDKQAFIKMMSGFGGCNAAMLFKKQN